MSQNQEQVRASLKRVCDLSCQISQHLQSCGVWLRFVRDQRSAQFEKDQFLHRPFLPHIGCLTQKSEGCIICRDATCCEVIYGRIMENNQISNLLKMTRTAFFINAAVWLAFGLASLFFRAIDESTLTRWVITVMMIANAIVMIWFGIMIPSGRSWIIFLAILYMALNVVLSIADQFGWVDAIILLLNLCVLGMLLFTRHRMSQATRAASGEL